MKRLLTILILLATTVLQAQSVTLAWDASASAGVTGYRVYYGTNSRSYAFVTNTALVTTQTVVLPHLGRWFFAATAHDGQGLESAFSNEVEWEAKPRSPVLQGELLVRLAPVIERSTNRVDWVNRIPVFETNVVQVPVANLVAKPAAVATIDATGTLVNTFLPGVGSLIALLLGGLYHGYRQIRNRRVNEALVQGVETARAILETTPQGQAVDAAFVKWLMEHQKEAGVFVSVSKLVDAFTDNPAAKLTAQEIAERVGKAQAGGA